jgi:riboflavin transporter FmnP
VNKKMTVESDIGFLQRYNILIGILIYSLFTSILLFFFTGVFFFFGGDIFLVAGCCLGLYFTFKKKQDSQSHIKTGVIVGAVGSVLVLVFFSLFVWIPYSLYYGYVNFLIFLTLVVELISTIGIIYIFVGLILGYLFGYYFRGKEGNEGNKRVSSRF